MSKPYPYSPKGVLKVIKEMHANDGSTYFDDIVAAYVARFGTTVSPSLIQNHLIELLDEGYVQLVEGAYTPTAISDEVLVEEQYWMITVRYVQFSKMSGARFREFLRTDLTDVHPVEAVRRIGEKYEGGTDKYHSITVTLLGAWPLTKEQYEQHAEHYAEFDTLYTQSQDTR